MPLPSIGSAYAGCARLRAEPEPTPCCRVAGGRPLKFLEYPETLQMKANKLEDLFLMTLADIYHGEKQIIKALPKMAKHADSRELKAALEHHLKETEGQVERLERVFKLMDKPARGEECEAIEGLI